MTTKYQPLFGETAYTLSHKRTSTYTFSRAARFRSQRRTANPDFISLPSTLDSRATSQGFGQRWKPGTRKDSPAPGSYDIPSSFELKTGPRFGKESPKKYRLLEDSIPGPGTYDMSNYIGKNGPKFSFRPRSILTKYVESPAPSAYLPNLTQTSAFKNISFGIGQRVIDYSEKSTNPGPGTYEVQSDFKNNWKH